MEVASGDDERRRTQDSTNADLRKRGKENSPMWKNCGGLSLFSGQKQGDAAA